MFKFKNRTLNICLTIMRPLIIVTVLVILFRNLNITVLVNGFSVIQWWTVVLSLTCSLIGLFFQGVRWWVLIRAFTIKLPFLRSMSVHLSSVFYSLVLPNSTVQEVIRTVSITKETGYVIGWSAAWVNKIIGVVVAFGISGIGLLISPAIKIPAIVNQIVFFLFFFMSVALVLSFSKKISRPIRTIISKFFPSLSLSWFEKFREGIYQFRNRKKMLLLSLLVTIVTQFFMLGGVSFLLFGITGKAYFAEVMAFIPLIEMVSMAQPFTPGGIGIREALVAVMFQHLGLSNEQLAIYVVTSNIQILLKLVGVVPVLYGMIKKKRLDSFVQKE
ncbi:MAG TPA: lysylphosphatidylglycerol synthase transmembrane domain-containing protein [Chitinispirillaceae bacterium]|nr:lysylphosphatidylglycerol synthase transmembrane domain-containing protein [Chitinispirillaceae bacterium]